MVDVTVLLPAAWTPRIVMIQLVVAIVVREGSWAPQESNSCSARARDRQSQLMDSVDPPRQLPAGASEMISGTWLAG